jgi:hypothetical protein
MKLYETPGGIKGYDRDELKAWMEKRHKWTSFSKWYRGSTGAIVDGHFIIYEHDVRDFYLRKSNTD